MTVERPEGWRLIALHVTLFIVGVYCGTVFCGMVSFVMVFIMWWYLLWDGVLCGVLVQDGAPPNVAYYTSHLFNVSNYSQSHRRREQPRYVLPVGLTSPR